MSASLRRTSRQQLSVVTSMWDRSPRNIPHLADGDRIDHTSLVLLVLYFGERLLMRLGHSGATR